MKKKYFADREQYFRQILQTTPAEQYPEKVLEAALGLVDLQYEKANSALNGLVKESVGFMDAMLKKPAGSETAIDHQEELELQIGQLFKMGQYDKGLHLLTFLPSDRERGHVLVESVGMLCKDRGRVQDALMLAQQIPPGPYKAIAFCKIAYVYAQDGKVDDAVELLQQSLNMAEGFDRDNEKCTVLEMIALGYGKLRKFGKAIEVMQQFQEVMAGKRINRGNAALTSQLFQNMAKDAGEDQIHELINLTKDQNTQNRIRLYLAQKLAKEGKTDEALAVWKDLIEKGMDVLQPGLIKELISEGRYQETVTLIEIITLTEKKDAHWCEMAEHLAQMGETDEVLTIVKRIRHHYYKTWALKALARAYIKSDQPDLAKALEAMIPEKQVDGFLVDIILMLAESILPETHDKVGAQIFELMEGISNKAMVNYKLPVAAIALAKRDCYRLAEELSKFIDERYDKNYIWETAGYWQSRQKGIKGALDSARQFENEETIHNFKQGIVKYCYQLNTIEEALGIIKEISNDSGSIESLLEHVALNEVFRGNPDPDILQRLNQSLNIQWAIDIVKDMPANKQK